MASPLLSHGPDRPRARYFHIKRLTAVLSLVDMVKSDISMAFLTLNVFNLIKLSYMEIWGKVLLLKAKAKEKVLYTVPSLAMWFPEFRSHTCYVRPRKLSERHHTSRLPDQPSLFSSPEFCSVLFSLFLFSRQAKLFSFVTVFAFNLSIDFCLFVF